MVGLHSKHYERVTEVVTLEGLDPKLRTSWWGLLYLRCLSRGRPLNEDLELRLLSEYLSQSRSARGRFYAALRLLVHSLTSKEDISALRRVLLSQNETWAQLTVQVLDSKSPKEAAKALSEIKDLSEIGSSISTTPSLGIQIVPNVPPYLVP